jgi:N-acetylmuramoyl-L-alanine amidase
MHTVMFDAAYLTSGRGGRPGTKLAAVKFIVLHWTANLDPGADAHANRDFFENHPQAEVASHFIVDDKAIVACVPTDEVAYHAGDHTTNLYSIGVEWCVNADSKGAETYRNVAGLVGRLLDDFNLDLDALIRHYDVCSVECPGFFVSDARARQLGWKTSAKNAWDVFRRDVRIASRAAHVARLLGEGVK